MKVPPELTGLTPEEEAYVPKTEGRPLPRTFFVVVAVILLFAFAGGGFWYYRNRILPEKLYQEATVLFNQERYDQALDRFLKVRRLRPERKDTLFQIGYCFEKMGRMGEAIDMYVAHLQNQPRDETALRRLGKIYVDLGQYQNALAPLDRAVKIAPRDPELRRLLGATYRELGSFERAAENFSMAVTWTSDRETLLALSKSLMQLKSYENALRGYEKAWKLDPSDKRALHGMNAAKAMLNIPTDGNFLAVPGKSLGAIALGMSASDLLAKEGEPKSRTTVELGGQEIEVWDYVKGGQSGQKSFRALVSKAQGVVQVETSSVTYRTDRGLGLSNFTNPKYASLFDRWQENTHERQGIRYSLKEGGLSFYVADLGNPEAASERRVLVVHRGKHAFGDDDDSLWSKIE